jgi:hypothetical protein
MLIMDILPYFIIFEIFYSCEVSNCDLLGYDTMQTSNWLLVLRRNLAPPSYPEDVGGKFLRNTGNHLQGYTVS